MKVVKRRIAIVIASVAVATLLFLPNLLPSASSDYFKLENGSRFQITSWIPHMHILAVSQDGSLISKGLLSDVYVVQEKSGKRLMLHRSERDLKRPVIGYGHPGATIYSQWSTHKPLDRFKPFVGYTFTGLPEGYDFILVIGARRLTIFNKRRPFTITNAERLNVHERPGE